MGVYRFSIYIILLTLIILLGWDQSQPTDEQQTPPSSANSFEKGNMTPSQADADYAEVERKYQGVPPQQWGEKVSCLAYRLDTHDKVIALTLDACGGSPAANGFDADLTNYLIREKIPATLFVSATWIEANPGIFRQLAESGIFEFGNHGLNHRPASVDGKSAYGIKGTDSPAELIREILGNHQIQALTGFKPLFYRSGTNYYDEVAVRIARELGYIPVGYSVAGDAGATFSREQVKKTLLATPAGSIVLLHFNHPEGQTAEGVMDAIPVLLQNGFRFVPLSAYPLAQYP